MPQISWLRYHATILTALQSHLYTPPAIRLLWVHPKALPHAVATISTPTASRMAYAMMTGFFRVDLVQTRLGSRLAVLRIVPQVDLLCQCLNPATDCFQERQNASINIFNCKGQGAYQCGWGDCFTNLTDQYPFTIILRDDQKSAVTSLPSKGSETLSLGFCLLVWLYLLYRQHCRLKLVESVGSQKRIEKPWGDSQWPHGYRTSPIPQRRSTFLPPSAHNPLIKYEAPPTTLSTNRGPQPPPKISIHRGLQEPRDASNKSYDLDGYSCGLNGTRDFV